MPAKNTKTTIGYFSQKIHCLDIMKIYKWAFKNNHFKYDGTSDIPLIVAMHGGFGNAYSIEYQSQLSTKKKLYSCIPRRSCRGRFKY